MARAGSGLGRPAGPQGPEGAPPVGLRTKLFYGFGSVAYGVKDNGFGVFLLLYYNQVLGLSAELAGLAILAALVIDAIIDPFIGHFSDNLHSRWGRKHPLMYVAAPTAAISYFFLWAPPAGLGQDGLFWYLLGAAIVTRTFITLYEIPSSSMVADLTPDYDQRTSLLSYRHFFGWMGGLSMALLAYTVFLRATPEYPPASSTPPATGAMRWPGRW
jgi:Na+/melibiose symporter-like transporter